MTVRQKTIFWTAALLFAALTSASAQQTAVKTNAAYWATATPNVAVEFTVSPRLTLEIGGGYNPFGSSEKSFKHLLIQPGLRWWFFRPMAGTFVGVHLHGGTYDLGGVGPLRTLKDNRYDGWLIGGGVSIGRHWLLSDRWGVEVEAGFGYAWMKYEKYKPGDGAETRRKFVNNYIGPTRLNISLVYYL